MIYDTLENLKNYRGLSANMDKAIDLLSGMDFSSLTAGRYEVDGDQLFYLVQEPQLRDVQDAQFEVHRRYADIQLALTDGEVINYLPITAVDRWLPFDEEKDIAFSDTAEKGIAMAVPAGCFAIYYPQDAHMPCLKGGAAETCRKLVVKVKL